MVSRGGQTKSENAKMEHDAEYKWENERVQRQDGG
jgi:hypothetical protein